MGDEYVFYLGRECRRQYSCGIVKAQLSERGRIGASVSSPYPQTHGTKTKRACNASRRAVNRVIIFAHYMRPARRKLIDTDIVCCFGVGTSSASVV